MYQKLSISCQDIFGEKDTTPDNIWAKNNEEQRVLIPRVFFKAQLGEKQVGSLFFYSSNQQQITSL